MRVVVRRSSKRNKKFAADVNGKIVRFGDPKYDDFTTHKNSKRKQLYIARHRKNENWSDMKTAGFWSKNLLGQNLLGSELFGDQKNLGQNFLFGQNKLGSEFLWGQKTLLSLNLFS